ncbi:MAG: hypothetical protein M1817_000137 [Caeruleum heppii]|nr:MAG: hypothetical protein M1817_000137 [Caeruleum heppii]
MVLGRLTHYAFDAVLISAFLAGVKRSTGLTLQSDKVSDSKELKRWVDSYLSMGEWVMDQSVAVLGSSGFFERKPLASPHPAKTFRELYALHHPRWFLPRHRLWFSDEDHTGKLLLAWFDRRTGTIQAYRLVTEKKPCVVSMWEHDPRVWIHSFEPQVRLHLDNPVIYMEPMYTSPAQTRIDGQPATRLQMETPVFQTEPSAAGSRVVTSFFHARRIYAGPEEERMTLWPPRVIPSSHYVRIDGSVGVGCSEHRPLSLAQMSDAAFRLRRWVEFRQNLVPVGSRMGEVIQTFATLHPQLYTPTATKIFRGIWVGDYSGHGCEFLVILQTNDEDGEKAAGEEASKTTTSGRDARYSGSLAAIKLTGDPNVPRGQFTFVSPDIGPEGMVRIAEEEPFRGARVVNSKGHIALRGFVDDSYLETQLILVSADRLAHYWMDFGHISYYHRVDIDAILATR